MAFRYKKKEIVDITLKSVGCCKNTCTEENCSNVCYPCKTDSNTCCKGVKRPRDNKVKFRLYTPMGKSVEDVFVQKEGWPVFDDAPALEVTIGNRCYFLTLSDKNKSLQVLNVDSQGELVSELANYDLNGV